jgi:hypothetical protein
LLKRGRPVNENSERQKRLNDLSMKRELGLVKRGRPVNGDSVRQMKLKELELKRNNGTLKLGRPKKVVVTDEVAA